MCEDNWHGSYYELAIQIGSRDDDAADERLRAALRAAWSDPTLDGWYLDRWMDPEAQQRVSPENLSLEHGNVYGWANPPLGRLVCSTHIVREEGEEACDWLDLCLPTGALGRIEPRMGHPIGGEDSRSWREPLDEWFVSIARRVARKAPFRVAIIGEEVSGLGHIADQSPSQRGVSVVMATATGVEWSPPDRW